MSSNDPVVSFVEWDEFARLASAPVTVTLLGLVTSVDEPAERVIFAPPDFWRVEDELGRLRYVANDAGHYQWRAAGGEMACFQARQPGYWHSGAVNSTNLVRPRDLVNPSDDDFTRPAGPVEETTFIGRRAWRVMLAPPSRKPQAVVQVLDVESGVTLAYQSPEDVTLVGFTELQTDIDVGQDVFVVAAGNA